MKKFVFAISDRSGSFEQLLQVNQDDIINMTDPREDDEERDGVGILTFLWIGVKTETFYISYIEVE